MGSYKYVVLGGGNSAGYAAAEFVEQGLKPGELAIITAEPVVSYERPTLSKAYLQTSGPRLPGFHACAGGGGQKQEPAWYKEKGITYMTNTKVTAADVKGKTLTTEAGETISYDKLIVATGSSVINLSQFGTKNANLKNIFYLRDVTDADALVASYEGAKAKDGTAAIVGGGYIGMEAAAQLTNAGFKVTMLFPEDRMMSRLFTPQLASFYEKYYEKKGVILQKGALVTGFEDAGDGTVGAAVTKDGKKFSANIVVVGVGAKPNTDLFDSQLELLQDRPGGIKVDSKLQTSNPDVYAIGDIAAFPLTLYGGNVTRQEHVTHARSSAKHAAKAALGKDVPDYEYLPFFYSREFSLSWKFYGASEGEVAHFGNFDDLDSPKIGAYWVQDGKVVGVFMEGASDEESAAMKAVALKKPASPGISELSSSGISFALKAQGGPVTASLGAATGRATSAIKPTGFARGFSCIAAASGRPSGRACKPAMAHGQPSSCLARHVQVVRACAPRRPVASASGRVAAVQPVLRFV